MSDKNNMNGEEKPRPSATDGINLFSEVEGKVDGGSRQPPALAFHRSHNNPH